MHGRQTTAAGTHRGADTRARAAGGGFTLVEMLVVIAIIIILISLLLVGLNLATRTAQRSNTQALMVSLKQGLVRFREDLGYYPPILATTSVNPPDPQDLRVLRQGPDPFAAGYAESILSWYSTTSLADYLVGYGTHREDGYGFIPDGMPGGPAHLEETPATGLRTPGPDGVWGAGPNGPLVDRNPVGTGKVYGPYLELTDERLLAATDGSTDADGRLNLYFPGDADYDPALPKVIVDYWGEPIRYFRRSYPRGAIGQSYRAGIDYTGDGDIDPVPTLSDVIYLRPFTLQPGAGTDSLLPDDTGDTTTSFALQTAEFALFSAGPDRVFEARIRFDENDFNRDNIVEAGP